MSLVNYKYDFSFKDPDTQQTSTKYKSFWGIIQVNSSGTITSMRVQNTLDGPLSSNVLLSSQTVGTKTSNTICQISSPAPLSGTLPYQRAQTSDTASILQINIGPGSSGVLFGPTFVDSTILPKPDYWLVQTTIPQDGEGLLHIYYYTSSTWTEVLSTDAIVSMVIFEAVNPACFIEGTKLFTHIKDKDVYVNIEHLRSGDLLNTYLHGKKKIKYIGKGSMINNPSQWNGCVRRLPKLSDMTDDLFVTGAHSILVDNISEKEKEGMLAIYGTIDRKIDDKTLLLSWVSNKFEAVNDNENYTYYHLVLEHHDDDTKRYGIWANGVLTESQCEKHFLEKNYELL